MLEVVSVKVERLTFWGGFFGNEFNLFLTQKLQTILAKISEDILQLHHPTKSTSSRHPGNPVSAATVRRS